MKHIYLAVLILVGLVLAGCGDTAEIAESQATLQALEFESDASELSLQAPGDPVELRDFIGDTYNFGFNTPTTTNLIRHANSLIQVELLSNLNANDPVFRADANFAATAPLADSDNTCFSLESQNFPGHYVRHAGSRVRIDPVDQANVELFNNDATWCVRTTLDGTFDNTGEQIWSFESFNFPGRYLRRFNNQVWLSQAGGPLASDNPANFLQDTRWSIYSDFEQ